MNVKNQKIILEILTFACHGLQKPKKNTYEILTFACLGRQKPKNPIRNIDICVS